ncbi:3'-5' exonuclease [Clostridioides difficile]
MELRDRKFILIDCETTGFDERKHQLLELGILVIKDLKVIDEFEVKIKHKEYTITAKSMEANKINILEHEGEALFEKEAAEKILEFLNSHKSENDEGYIVIGQNVQFDIKFLEEMFLRTYKIKEYRQAVSYRSLDIMQLAMIKNIEGKISLEKQDLDSILNELDIEISENRHRALTDCYLEFEALIALLDV